MNEKLLHDALRVIKSEVSDVGREHPVAYDSQSNGAIENCVKQVQGLARTLKLSIEKKLHKKIPNGHPLISWPFEHTAWILTSRGLATMGKRPMRKSNAGSSRDDWWSSQRCACSNTPPKAQDTMQKEN